MRLFMFGVIALLIFVPTCLPAAEPKSAATYEPPTKQEPNKAEHYQQPPKAANEDANGATSKHEQAQQSFGNRFLDFTLTDALIAVFTVVLAAVGYKQWIALSQSVKVGEKAADAATQTVRTMDATTVTQLRAYIGVTDISLKKPDGPVADMKPIEMVPGARNPLYIHLEFKNGGQTPAYEVNCHLNWQPVGLHQRLPKDFAYKDYDTTSKAGVGPVVSKYTLMPGNPSSFDVGLDVPTMQKVFRGDCSIFFYGHIDYIDVFKNARITEFCFFYWPSKDGHGEAFTTYTEHNNAT